MSIIADHTYIHAHHLGELGNDSIVGQKVGEILVDERMVVAQFVVLGVHRAQQPHVLRVVEQRRRVYV